MKSLVLITTLWLTLFTKLAAANDTLRVDGLSADSIVNETVTDVQPETPRKLSLLRRIIRGFDRLDNHYIEPQHYVFTVMLQAVTTYDLYRLSGVNHDAQSVTFRSEPDIRIGPYVGWKWFFAGYTLDMRNLSLRRKKLELDLSIYSSQIGLDLFYRRTGSDYKLRNVRLGKDVDASPLNGLPFDGIKVGITGAGVYYIFNHGRFSYPAAFSQSTIQKISCGSWLAGIGYTNNSLEFDYQRLQDLVEKKLSKQIVEVDSGLMFNSVNYHDFKVSGGYAYNWVFAPQWLLGISGQAALAYKKSSGIMLPGNDEGYSIAHLHVDAIGRFGIVYNNMRWYAGMSAIVNTNSYYGGRFSTNNTFGNLNLYVGYNFGLKKKYRANENK